MYTILSEFASVFLVGISNFPIQNRGSWKRDETKGKIAIVVTVGPQLESSSKGMNEQEKKERRGRDMIS